MWLTKNKNTKNKNIHEKYKHIILLIITMFFVMLLSLHHSSIAITKDDFSNINNTKYLQSVLDNKDTIYMIYDSKNKKVLDFKNHTKKVYPASLTKMVLGILTIENLNLNQNVLIKSSDTQIPQDYMVAPIIPGETLTVQKLLELLLVSSCNDAALALERTLNEKTGDYEELRNDLFYKLKLKNTNFTNSYGLDNKNHYSTAEDLLCITTYCMRNPEFANIVKMDSVNINKKEYRHITKKESTNLFLNSKKPLYDKSYIGVKTGYTSMSGFCYIGAKKINDITYYTVLLNAKTNVDRFAATKQLFANLETKLNNNEKFEKKYTLEFEKSNLEKAKDIILKNIEEIRHKDKRILYITSGILLFFFILILLKMFKRKKYSKKSVKKKKQVKR